MICGGLAPGARHSFSVWGEHSRSFATVRLLAARFGWLRLSTPQRPRAAASSSSHEGGRSMSRIPSLVFAACLFVIGASTSVPAASPDWPKSLTLGTASPGGVYYVYGDELAKILTEKLGIAVNPFPTQGAIQNVKLLDSGGAQLGLITMSTGLEGWNGSGDWTKGQTFRQVRALFPMYDNPFQAVVLQRSGIASLAQLDKKRIGVGPRSGNGATSYPGIFKIGGLSAELRYGSYNDIATELLAGRIDALLTLLGAPVPAIQDVDAKEPVTFLNLSPEQMEAICKAMPEFGPAK